ncbi:acyltransferase [Streptomyces sp. NPDC058623]|uniref:acyltransferase family protein n=1 Tax=Streptomyces sp. NPDC058623 TaxID=3346563 RepID=UPI00365B6800
MAAASASLSALPAAPSTRRRTAPELAASLPQGVRHRCGFHPGWAVRAYENHLVWPARSEDAAEGRDRQAGARWSTTAPNRCLNCGSSGPTPTSRTAVGSRVGSLDLILLGPVGVSLFFVLSGFVLSVSARKTDTAGAFWRRRLMKIYPTTWSSGPPACCSTKGRECHATTTASLPPRPRF